MTPCERSYLSWRRRARRDMRWEHGALPRDWCRELDRAGPPASTVPRGRLLLRVLAAVIAVGCALGLLMCAVAAACARLGV